MASVRQGGIRRLGLRWLLPFMIVFVIPLAITAVRVQYREQMGRIASLERQLQDRQADEAYLTVSIERACDYSAVQKQARDVWKMKVAGREQRFLLGPATTAELASQSAEAGGGGSLIDRAERLLRGGVAQAQSATGERTVRAR
jgi:hypothetical protein